jgi:hypothetical protein
VIPVIKRAVIEVEGIKTYHAYGVLPLIGYHSVPVPDQVPVLLVGWLAGWLVGWLEESLLSYAGGGFHKDGASTP